MKFLSKNIIACIVLLWAQWFIGCNTTEPEQPNTEKEEEIIETIKSPINPEVRQYKVNTQFYSNGIKEDTVIYLTYLDSEEELHDIYGADDSIRHYVQFDNVLDQSASLQLFQFLQILNTTDKDFSFRFYTTISDYICVVEGKANFYYPYLAKVTYSSNCEIELMFFKEAVYVRRNCIMNPKGCNISPIEHNIYFRVGKKKNE